jgi:hypothetical protein
MVYNDSEPGSALRWCRAIACILDQDLGYVFLHSPFAEKDTSEGEIMRGQE